VRSGRGWLAGDWPSTGGVLNITAEAWTAGFHWWRSGNKKRTQNVSEYVPVLALCLVVVVAEDEEGEEVFSDEEFEAEMKQKQRQTVPPKHSQVSASFTTPP